MSYLLSCAIAIFLSFSISLFPSLSLFSDSFPYSSLFSFFLASLHRKYCSIFFFHTIVASKTVSLTKRKNKLLLWRWLENWHNTSEHNPSLARDRLDDLKTFPYIKHQGFCENSKGKGQIPNHQNQSWYFNCEGLKGLWRFSVLKHTFHYQCLFCILSCFKLNNSKMPTLTTSAQPFTSAKQMRRVSVPGHEKPLLTSLSSGKEQSKFWISSWVNLLAIRLMWRKVRVKN